MFNTIVETRKIIWVCLLLGLLLFLVELLKAQESEGSAGTFLQMGVGARPLAMGGAFVGLADDASATYWNPAGLASLNHIQLEFMNVNLPLDRTYNFFSGVFPLKNIATFGVSWIGMRVAGIEGRTSNSAEPEFTFGNNQNAVFLSIGKTISPFLSIGGSIKFIKNDLQNISATGLGFDASALIKATDRLRLGLLVQDIGTDYRWDNNVTEGVPMHFRAGVAYEVYDGVTIAVDADKGSHSDPDFHIGGEIRPVENLPIRLGYNGSQVTGGAGFLFPLSNHALELNYAYSNDRIFNEAVHRLSVVFSFGVHEPRYRGNGAGAILKNTPRFRKADHIDLGEIIVVKAKVLNVRSGPGTKYRKVAKVFRGEKLKAFEAEGQWRRIKLRNGKKGWVHNKYVR